MSSEDDRREEAGDDEELTRRALEACARRGLHGDDVFLVLALLERPERAWPACCESGCEPCMKTLHAAAREALADPSEASDASEPS